MNKLSLEDFTHDNAKIEVTDNSSGVTVHFSGKINMKNPGEVFNPYLDKLHQSLVDNQVKEVVADFTNLSFLNSSGLKTLIRWIMQIARLDADKKYRINIKYTNKYSWQETSLTTFSSLVPDLVTEEPVG